ncbi:hypothetical protein [Sphingomonas sp. PR090111-T3T-6A]|uniref:hypothetical protein n=1 Tax=Sphingomonas sp. PR090111-T3T-6A TaxID=685778 RepID=UPI00037D7A36|nr:hypothetical protein [Sphingomonas sp. PR090111-T3T-6A]
MTRTLFVALIATAALSGAAHAQSGRPMPSYDDGEPPQAGGYYDSYGTADAREDADRGASSHWVTPKPYARADQVDEGTPNDAAHRADRAYTAQLNRNANTRPARSPGTRSSAYSREQAQYQAELAAHDRAMDDYRYARQRYAQRIANWRARADACEAGNIDACDGPE